ncbi:hypothetical protein BD626DRAFT_559481 [Schizophyllum amplum]|uniref:NAD(P)-binding protein n=1 Tax=Schizophyllum amplum TaxID=97359 RepID=A0A550C3X7_9AGAR|nr:hypothetical protein BD626DRAFT_559481 [Auriculariopsis ampla]
MNKHLQFLRESYPPAPEWGRVMVITGANTGTSQCSSFSALLQHNATVYMFCRSETRAQAAIADLKEQTGKEARFVHCDLADLPSVKRCADEFLSKESQLHVLFNNGFVFTFLRRALALTILQRRPAQPRRTATAQGYDLQFGANVLGHFYLTTLLLPLMQATARPPPSPPASSSPPPSCTGTRIRSTTTCCASQTRSARRRARSERVRGSTYLYAHSKLATVLCAKELARRYGDEGIVCISLHPGQAKTRPLQARSLRSCAMRAGTDPEAAGWNGKYMTCWARLYHNNPAADDEAEARKLWEWMEEQVRAV